MEGKIIKWKEYIYVFKSKIPEGQEHAPRLEPTAPIRLADRNHVHHPSRQRTIPNKKTARWRTSCTRKSIHTGVIGRCYTYSWRTSLQGAFWHFPPLPKEQPVRRSIWIYSDYLLPSDIYIYICISLVTWNLVRPVFHLILKPALIF